MPTVRASCPSCGDVDLSTGDVQVQQIASGGDAAYAFTCPRCRSVVTKPASRRVVDLLVAAGVPVVASKRPAELDEPHAGSPITYDDLLAFHFDLVGDGWLEALISTSGGR